MSDTIPTCPECKAKLIPATSDGYLTCPNGHGKLVRGQTKAARAQAEKEWLAQFPVARPTLSGCYWQGKVVYEIPLHGRGGPLQEGRYVKSIRRYHPEVSPGWPKYPWAFVPHSGVWSFERIPERKE